jgi:hypothetical protein
MLAIHPVRTLAAITTAALGSALLVPSEAEAQQPTLPATRWSAAADLAADLTADGPTLRDSSRFALRELELGASARIAGLDALVLLRARDASRVSVHQAVVGGALPLGMRGRAGRFALPFGRLNEVHGHALPTLEAPHAHVRYLGDANVSGNGVALARALGPLELTLAAVDHLRRDTTGRRALDLPNQYLSGLGYVGRVSAHGSVAQVGARLDASAMTGRRLQPLSERAVAGSTIVDAVVARQSVLGGELVLGRRDTSDAARGWTLVGQALWQLNERESSLRSRIPSNPATGGPFYDGPTRDVLGLSVTGRVPLWRRLALVARGDRVEESDFVGGATTAATVQAEWATLGGVLLSAGWESLRRPEREALHRLLLRARGAVGEHPPWPF